MVQLYNKSRSFLLSSSQSSPSLSITGQSVISSRTIGHSLPKSHSLSTVSLSSTFSLSSSPPRRRISSTQSRYGHIFRPLSRRCDSGLDVSSFHNTNTKHISIQLMDLPDELLLCILEWLLPSSLVSQIVNDTTPTPTSNTTNNRSTSNILTLRLTCQKFAHLSIYLLKPLILANLSQLTSLQTQIDTDCNLISEQVQPILSYNQRFMNTSFTIQQLRELSSYTRPPYELHLLSIALLHLIYPNDIVKLALNDWSHTRRLLLRTSTRNWINRLSDNNENSHKSLFITDGDWITARSIIANMNITYDRMRSVSLTGYHLLIMIAATLAYLEPATRLNNIILYQSRVNNRITQLSSLHSIITSNGQHNDHLFS